MNKFNICHIRLQCNDFYLIKNKENMITCTGSGIGYVTMPFSLIWKHWMLGFQVHTGTLSKYLWIVFGAHFSLASCYATNYIILRTSWKAEYKVKLSIFICLIYEFDVLNSLLVLLKKNW